MWRPFGEYCLGGCFRSEREVIDWPRGDRGLQVRQQCTPQSRFDRCRDHPRRKSPCHQCADSGSCFLRMRLPGFPCVCLGIRV